MHPVDDRASGTFCVLPATRSADRRVVGTVFAPSSQQSTTAFTGEIDWLAHWSRSLLVPGRLPRRFAQIFKARRYDVIFVQRSMFRWTSPPIVEWVAKRVTGLPIAYHLDDGIWLAARRRWSEQRCRLATTVVTGNEAVTQFAESAGASVTHIEYAVDASAYPVKSHFEHSPVAIGYTGIAPEEHLRPIVSPLRDVCEATGARVKVVGGLHRSRSWSSRPLPRLSGGPGTRTTNTPGPLTLTSGLCPWSTVKSTVPRNH